MGVAAEPQRGGGSEVVGQRWSWWCGWFGDGGSVVWRQLGTRQWRWREWWRCGGEMVADEMVMDMRWWCYSGCGRSGDDDGDDDGCGGVVMGMAAG
ncbi:hypothetical protein Tco_0725076 [Tanacetum coccineum]|uniref:Uncharacterized protein n=1 Tax=Tanacetum coccineum TaxID=301880 RepID=A0ABQ4YBV2_9ASTR